MMKSCKQNHLATRHNEEIKGSSIDLRMRKSLGRLAMEHHVTLIEGDDTSQAAFITGFVVEGIIHHCHWHARFLTEQQKKAIWLVMLAMTERLCGPLDTTSEQAAMCAAMWVFRHDNSYLFGTMIKEMKAEYLSLMKQTKKRAQIVLLNRSITALLSDGDISHTKRIARVAGILASPHEPSLEIH
jgi:hypothetical protein